MKTFILFISLFLLCATAYTQTLPTGFNSTNATPGATWEQPVGAVFSQSGNQLFVWEKAGLVYVCTRDGDGDYIRQTNPVLDISEEVGNYHDYGLLGFALDPQFASNGFIYASYVVDRHHLLYYGTPSYNPATTVEYEATIGRITRYHTLTSGGIVSLDPAPGSRKVLLGDTKETGLPILYASHGMGSLAFAADGTLLASMGDGASFNGVDVGPGSDAYHVQALADGIIRDDENVGAWRSQMLTSLSGKLIRIDAATGSGISSNPFFEAAAPFSTKSKIWALGFRNPFRFSIKPGQGSTNPSDGHIGEVFVGDVGLGVWEELNVVKDKGMNFGWPWYEGLSFQPYFGVHTENKEVPIPGAYPCGTRQYARFYELIRQDNGAGDRRVYYPCYGADEPVPAVMSNERHNIHARPVLDWLHASEGIGPNARVGVFDAVGAASVASIGTSASGATGALFNGNASTGGIWYTGSSFPPEYTNTFLLADYGGRWIKKITFDITDKVTQVDAFASNIGTVVCMAENPIDGSVVYVDYGDGTSSNPGSVNKIVFGGNMPPVAKITSDIYYSENPSMTINFDGADSYDPDGTIATYAWDFGDPTSANNTSTSSTPAHIFSNAGPKKYTVKLTVTDNGGKSSTEQFIVSVNNTPPVVNITSPIDGYKYRVGGDTTFLLTASVSDAEHLSSELSYEWQTILIHSNHTHAEPTDNNPSTSAVIKQIGCTGDYHYLMRLKVSDGAGLFTIDSSQVYPNCASPLPIFLHKFSVTQSGAANVVKWTTELESNIEYFEVERSPDGINFSSINRQEASNAPGPNHYSFTDKRFLPGFNYYRLKIVEHGSIIRYSVVVRTVADDEKSILKVVPNPVVSNFSLTYQSPEKDRVVIQIRDITGRLLHTLKEDVNKGQNVIYMQNLPNWNSGIYFISVQNKDEIMQAKFIKAR